MMNEERKLILEMLKEGTVSVEEAERLLSALAGDKAALAEEFALAEIPEGTSGTRGGAQPIRPKRIIVNVTSNGKPVVNVRLPFSLVRVGLKMGKSVTGIGAKYSQDTAQAYEILKELDIDELLDSISDGDITLPYTIVDVDDNEKQESVRIVLE